MKTLLPLIYTFVTELMQKIENLPVIVNSLNLNASGLHNTLLLNWNANGLKNQRNTLLAFITTLTSLALLIYSFIT